MGSQGNKTQAGFSMETTALSVQLTHKCVGIYSLHVSMVHRVTKPQAAFSMETIALSVQMTYM